MDPTVNTILGKDIEDRQWDLYCAIVANPFADDVGGFDDFRRQINGGPPSKEKKEDPVMNETQIKLQVESASKILDGFVPPEKGDG